MITAIYSFLLLGSLRGMGIWMLLWIGCIALYFILFSLFPKNRSPKGRLYLLLYYGVSELVLDVLFGIYLWRFPALLEYGFGITYGLILFAVFLVIGGTISTICRYREEKTVTVQE